MLDIRPAWHSTAPCRGRVDVYYPPPELSRLSYTVAARICSTCPHLEPCRQEGDELEHGRVAPTIGYRAGETPSQRRQRRRTARLVAVPETVRVFLTVPA